MSKKTKKQEQQIPLVDSLTINDLPDYIRATNKKFITMNWDKVFVPKKIPSQLKNISIGKKSFGNKIDLTVKYINYFIHWFDPDNELMSTYLYLLFMIALDDGTELSVDDFIDITTAHIGSSSMIDKICNMIEVNADKSLIKTEKGKTYDQALQLTFEHLKGIMGISILFRMLIPVVSQYYKMRHDEVKKVKLNEKQFYYKCFASVVGKFDEKYDISLYNKLYTTTMSRVSKTAHGESKMWARRERSGVTVTSFINRLIIDLLVDVAQKGIFSKSMIIYIHVCLDESTSHELEQQDKFEMNDMEMETSESESDEVTRFDLMQINNAKVSERFLQRSNVSIKDTINRLAHKYDIDFEEEEIDFYREYINPTDAQKNVLFLYFAPYFASYDNLEMVEPVQYIKLIILAKTMMKKQNFKYLPQLISGKIEKNKNRRTNKKKTEKAVESHPKYEDLVKQYKDVQGIINKMKLIESIISLTSAPVLCIDYNKQDRLLDPLNIPEDIVIDELVRMTDAL